MPTLEEIIRATWGNPSTAPEKTNLKYRTNWGEMGDASQQVPPPLPTNYKEQIAAQRGLPDPNSGFADRIMSTIAAGGLGAAFGGPVGAAAMAVGANVQGLNKNVDDIMEGLNFVPAVGMGAAMFPLTKGPKPVFHSAVQESVRGLNVGEHTKLPEAQTMTWLRGMKGISPIELDELKLGELWKTHPNPTKQTVLDWIDANRVHISEEVKTVRPLNKADEANFERHTQPGGENYRELSFVTPVKTEEIPVYNVYSPKGDKLWAYNSIEEATQALNSANSDSTLTKPYTLVKEPYSYGTRTKPDFISPDVHKQPPNTLAFARIKDRITKFGQKVLGIEETQSDLQKIQREYQEKTSPVTPESVQKTWDFKMAKLLEEKGYKPTDYGIADTTELLDPWRIEHQNKFVNQRIEQAKLAGFKRDTAWLSPEQIAHPQPLANKYIELASKRLLRLAADEDKAGITIVPGEEQARRWGKEITDNISKLEYNLDEGVLTIHKPNNVIYQKDIPPARLGAEIGDDIAGQLLSRLPKSVDVDNNPFWVGKGLHLRSPLPDFLSPQQQQLYMRLQQERQSAREEIRLRGTTTPNYIDLSNRINEATNNLSSLNDEASRLQNKFLYEHTPPIASLPTSNLTLGGEGYRHVYNNQLPKQIVKEIKRYTGVEVKPEMREVEIRPETKQIKEDFRITENPFGNLTSSEAVEKINEALSTISMHDSPGQAQLLDLRRSIVNGGNWLSEIDAPYYREQIGDFQTALSRLGFKYKVNQKTVVNPAQYESHLFIPLPPEARSKLKGRSMSQYLVPAAATLGGSLLQKQIRDWQANHNTDSTSQ